MSRQPRTHLITKGRWTACGTDANRSTTNPEWVTCSKCRRTLAMADAEVRSNNRRPRRQIGSRS